MKILAIIDSFKGTITSERLGELTKERLLSKCYQVDTLPISDGGDGFLAVIKKFITAEKVLIQAHNAKMSIIDSYYLFDESSKTAYLEVAQTVGINLLKPDELNTKNFSSYGVGEQIKHAINQKGAKKILVGLGGSATSDGGAGMLEALGVKFYDENNNLISNIMPLKFKQIASIDITTFGLLIKDIDFTILADVDNQLLGEKGAVKMFSKQKGASDSELIVLEENLAFYASIMDKYCKTAARFQSGAGAAGGLGYAFLACFHAKKESGIEYILKLMNLANIEKEYDVIITGEGQIDEQSLHGKVISGVQKIVDLKKIILVSAVCTLPIETLKKYPFRGIYSIVPDIADINESLSNPEESFLKLIDSIF